MKFLRRFLIRFSNLITRQSADQRLQEEIAEHLAIQTEENVRAGMMPGEARRQAALKLGAAQAIREWHHAEQSLPFIDNLLFDLRYALRMLGDLLDSLSLPSPQWRWASVPPPQSIA